MEQVAGPLIFLLLGLATPALAALNGFHFVNQSKNWTEAQSYCRDKFTDLATVKNEDDWTTVKEMVTNSGYTRVWLGLYADVKSWRWSLDNTSLNRTDLGRWVTFHEDTNGAAEHCVVVKDRHLHDHGCRTQQRSVCYNETANSYITVTEPMSWHRAQSYCREHHTDLASIRDQQDLDAIIGKTDPAVLYWMGLSKERWNWSDQSPSSFRRWASDQPDKDAATCGAAGRKGWFDRLCSKENPFICSVPPVPRSLVVRVTVKTHGSGNVNNRCQL